MERIELTQEERNFIKRRPGKVAYIAVARFRGPRGRRYRPLRTKPHFTPEAADAAALEMRSRPYAHGAFSTGHVIYRVDFIGRVQAEEPAA
jgi:hypothetical protein